MQVIVGPELYLVAVSFFIVFRELFVWLVMNAASDVKFEKIDAGAAR